MHDRLDEDAGDPLALGFEQPLNRRKIVEVENANRLDPFPGDAGGLGNRRIIPSLFAGRA